MQGPFLGNRLGSPTIPWVYGNCRFITTITSVLHRMLYRDSWSQSTTPSKLVALKFISTTFDPHIASMFVCAICVYMYMVRINCRSILQNLMTDASSVTKLFIPPSDRRLRRTTTSKLPSEHAFYRHKFQDTPTTLVRWGSHFPPTMVYAFPARWQ
jgi:hypothetical protein